MPPYDNYVLCIAVLELGARYIYGEDFGFMAKRKQYFEDFQNYRIFKYRYITT